MSSLGVGAGVAVDGEDLASVEIPKIVRMLGSTGLDIGRDEIAVKRLINRVSVDAAFFKKLSPMENLLFAARLYGLDGRTARREAILILARLGISERRYLLATIHRAENTDSPARLAAQLRTGTQKVAVDEFEYPLLFRIEPELGAIDFIAKPDTFLTMQDQSVREQLDGKSTGLIVKPPREK